MLHKLISAFLETDDNSFQLDGYNLSHRLLPMKGQKMAIQNVFQVVDPVSGRNLDRVILKFYSDQFFVDEVNRKMQLEIDRLTAELNRSFAENKKQLEDHTKERIRLANEKVEQANQRALAAKDAASGKVEKMEATLDDRKNQIIEVLEREYRNKLKIAESVHLIEIQTLKAEVSKLERELKKLQEKEPTEIVAEVPKPARGRKKKES